MKMNAKNLKAGKTVYYVHALGEKSYVSKYIVLGIPQNHLRFGNGQVSPSLYLPVKRVRENGTFGFADVFSLRDCNVDAQNGYNSHRLFFKKKAADRYCEMCKDLVIGSEGIGAGWKNELSWAEIEEMFSCNQD